MKARTPYLKAMRLKRDNPTLVRCCYAIGTIVSYTTENEFTWYVSIIRTAQLYACTYMIVADSTNKKFQSENINNKKKNLH